MRKYILVTGGTKGIGRAIIEKFASQGFHIITCARSEKHLQNLKLGIEQAYTFSKVEYLPADLSREKDRNAFIEFVRKLNVKVDVLVNNTGLFVPGKITEEDDSVLPCLIETNLYSAYYITKAIAPEMVKRRTGHIFNICSIASITAYPNGGSYSITKFAMLGMSKVLREEMKPHNVRVTSVLPGATFTESWAGVDLPEDRFVRANDVAESVWGAYALSKNAVIEELIIRPQLGDIN